MLFLFYASLFIPLLSACFIIRLQKPADYPARSRHTVIFGGCVKKSMHLIPATWMTTTAI